MKDKRFFYAVLGVLAMLFAGSIYGWSVYQAAMAQEFTSWAVSQFSLNFSLVITFFCFGTLAVGFLSNKVPMKLLMIISAIMIFSGYLIAARMQTPFVLYLGYGVMCGFAIGMIYNGVLTTVLKWFPDWAGLISGILLMGFGFSTMLICPIFTKINAVAGWRTAFTMIGIITAIVFLFVGILLKAPAPDCVMNSEKKNSTSSSSVEEVATGVMLRRPMFWMYFVFTTVLSAGGLAVNSHSYAMATQVLGGNVAAYATMLSIIVSLFSVLNGAGRLIFGFVFDKIGQNKTLSTICLSYVISCAILVLAITSGSFPLLVAGLLLCGFSYGGIQPANSAYVRRNFGAKYYSVNFSIVVLNLLIASYLGPLVSGKLYDSMKSYVGTAICLCLFTVISVVCVAGIIIGDKKREKRLAKN